jgi:protein-L-isoaspartate(D-aspartate) O-methyltransferase
VADEYEDERRRMVERQIAARGLRHEAVLAAMCRVPRHAFVDERSQGYAYEDRPLPIGEGQTISQPYMVAIMTAALLPAQGDAVLEIGTGSGYQTAVLAELVAKVYTIERIASLQDGARKVLDELGYANVEFAVGDGTMGLPEYAPYEGILVTAGAPRVPEALKAQLAERGRLVIPVGSRHYQELVRVTRKGESFYEETMEGCAFVPLIGQEGWGEGV